MATIIFDFDSTLVTFESLEEVLKSKNLDKETVHQMETITAQGMSGEISFLDSLEKRLSITPVQKEDFFILGENAAKFVTSGIKNLIKELQQKSIDIWIISGAVTDVMLPVSKELGIPDSHILGIELLWDKDGTYKGIDKNKAINRSKWEGAKEVSQKWTSPKIAVGDGITDYALYEHHLVDHFIAFTANANRSWIADKNVPKASTVDSLRNQLIELLK